MFIIEFEKKENIMEEPQENSTVPFPNWPSSFNSIHPCSEINDFAIVDEPRQSNNMNFAPGFFPYLTIPQNMQNPNFENANAYMVNLL